MTFFFLPQYEPLRAEYLKEFVENNIKNVFLSFGEFCVWWSVEFVLTMSSASHKFLLPSCHILALEEKTRKKQTKNVFELLSVFDFTIIMEHDFKCYD